MKEGGYDQKVNETVNVVASKTWGIMKGVMAMASQKVEEYTKEGSSWPSQPGRNGYYQEFGHDSVNSSAERYESVNSWDDWDQKGKGSAAPVKEVKSGGGDSWAGWDDGKDDGNDGHYQSSSNKGYSQNGKSGGWSEGGFL